MAPMSAEPATLGQNPLAKSDTPRILMCKPTYFTVSYAINPWMEEAEPCDVELAKREWDDLYKALTEKAGAEVLLMDPVDGLPDLVFTANAAVVRGDKAVIAHYRYPQRQGEEPHVEKWFQKQGFKTITMPEDIYFEGAGDGLIWNNELIFAGYGPRTDIASHSILAQETGLPVVSLELNPRFYHIDVCLCPLSNGDLIYSPDAVGPAGVALIEERVPKKHRIPVAAGEASRFACNAVNVNDTVVLNHGSVALVSELKSRGFQVVEVNMSEFIKSGGSCKCLTLRVA